jgi:TetR/AcrR family transcriptional regulator, cholesterol catabolism regulator
MDAVKHEILKASLHYFLHHGIRKMSNDKLVSLLGISTKTLYKHFRDKEDLLEQALELHYSQQHALFENLSREERAPVLLFYAWQQGFELEYKVNKIFYQDLHYYYPELGKKVDTRNGKKIWKELTQLVRRGIQEGDLLKDMVPEAVLESMSVLYISIVRQGDFKKLGLSPNAILLNTFAAYIRGICTEKGTKALDKRLASIKVSQQSTTSNKKVLVRE